MVLIRILNKIIQAFQDLVKAIEIDGARPACKTFIKRSIRFALRHLLKILNKIKAFIVYRYLSFFVLGLRDYKTFSILRSRLNDNYSNIARVDSIFFLTRLKSHIVWISSDEFQEEYGDFISLCKNSCKTKQPLIQEINTSATPPLLPTL